MNAITRYIADRIQIASNRPMLGVDTSSDPELYHIEEGRFEEAYAYRNTGAGWIFIRDFASRQAAEKWVAEREEEEA